METICAISSAVGGAISVLRLSGDNAFGIAGKCWQGRNPLSQLPPRQLCLGHLIGKDGTIDAQCMAVRMPGPHSYTGEDIVEIHCHGGPVCAKAALEELLRQGATMAPPGEFTRRAFLNGKMELTQAEAVQELLEAGSSTAARLANHQLQGNLGRVVNHLYDTLHGLLCEIESRLDFPEEELDFQSPEQLNGTLRSVMDEMEKLMATRRCGEILRGGLTLAITGAPNVGKSSLLNLLLGQDRAIVSNIPGTTRDTIDAHISIRGIPIRIIDTAGIRTSDNAIEQTGIERSQAAAANADIVLWMTDASNEAAADFPGWSLRGQLLRVVNKMDLFPDKNIPEGCIGISAATGKGIDALYDAIEQAAWHSNAPEEYEIAISVRHAELLQHSIRAITAAVPLIENEEWELAALSLHDGLEAAGTITGRTVTPDLLDTIFHKFCIGK